MAKEFTPVTVPTSIITVCGKEYRVPAVIADLVNPKLTEGENEYKFPRAKLTTAQITSLKQAAKMIKAMDTKTSYGNQWSGQSFQWLLTVAYERKTVSFSVTFG